MAVLSTMLELGTPAPDFEMPDVVSEQSINLKSFEGKQALLVMFICKHCPYVKHINQELSRLGRDYGSRNVGIVAISSNSVESQPDDSPEFMVQQANEESFTFPYCYDESQETAKAYTAACTPDFFLFDGERRLVYRGQLDESRPKNDIPVTGGDIRAALDAVLAGADISPDQKPSMGCNVKWKPGNEPDYFL